MPWSSFLFLCPLYILPISGTQYTTPLPSTSSLQQSADRPPQIAAEGPEQAEARLLQHLLRNYDRSVRPVRNASSTVTVKLGLTLTSIFDLEEKAQVMTLNVWLDQEWQDELMTWDPKQFGNISNLRVPSELLWLPDTVLYNSADDFTVNTHVRAMVFHTGTVFWPPPIRLRSLCKIDVRFFPFDSQCCLLKFGSWSYHGGQLDITNRSTNIDLSNFVESGEFELVRVHQKRRVVKYSCCPEEYPDIRFYIHILYYVHNLILPCIMMSILSIAGFLLPPQSGEKVALGITVLLAFSVFVLAICEKMVMGLTTASIVTTVGVLHCHYQGGLNEPAPQWMRTLFLVRIRRLLRINLPNLDTIRTSAPQTPTNYDGKYRRATLIETNGAVHRLDLINSALKERPNALYKKPLEGENNGEPNHNNTHSMRRSSSQTILHSLQELLRQQNEDTRRQRKAEEWRQIALVIDRLLFFLFLVCTIGITCIMLVLVPMWRAFFYDDQFDEELFGLE